MDLRQAEVADEAPAAGGLHVDDPAPVEDQAVASNAPQLHLRAVGDERLVPEVGGQT